MYISNSLFTMFTKYMNEIIRKICYMLIKQYAITCNEVSIKLVNMAHKL